MGKCVFVRHFGDKGRVFREVFEWGVHLLRPRYSCTPVRSVLLQHVVESCHQHSTLLEPPPGISQVAASTIRTATPRFGFPCSPLSTSFGAIRGFRWRWRPYDRIASSLASPFRPVHGWWHAPRGFRGTAGVTPAPKLGDVGKRSLPQWSGNL